jgi:hypothetical protein
MTEKEKFVELTIQAPQRNPEDEVKTPIKKTNVSFEIKDDISFEVDISIDFSI